MTERVVQRLSASGVSQGDKCELVTSWKCWEGHLTRPFRTVSATP